MHELSLKLGYGSHPLGLTFDEKVREYMAEKAQELVKQSHENFNDRRSPKRLAPIEVRRILGLTDKEEVCNSNHPNDGCAKSAMEKKWCEHMKNGFDGLVFFGNKVPYFHFCPICGTPRPKEKSLAEKFKEVRSRHEPFSDFIDETQAEYLAKIAEQHFAARRDATEKS